MFTKKSESTIKNHALLTLMFGIVYTVFVYIVFGSVHDAVWVLINLLIILFASC